MSAEFIQAGYEHAYCSMLIDPSMRAALFRLLGHTNISTTQRYMHLDDNELADAQDLID